jgi:hypothetical protein
MKLYCRPARDAGYIQICTGFLFTVNLPVNKIHLPGKTAGQDCWARLLGKTAGQDCWARLLG